MEDLKIKHLTNALILNGTTRLQWKDTGESFCPTVADITRYSEFYVTKLFVRDNELVINMQSEI